jgi:MFS family permease
VPNLAHESRRHRRQDSRDGLGTRSDGGSQLRVAERRKPGREALDDRAECRAASGRHRGAPNHLERLLQTADAADRLADEPAHAHAAAPGHEQSRAPAIDGGLERDGEVGQLPLPPHEPFAAEPRGHGAIVPHRHGAPTHRYPSAAMTDPQNVPTPPEVALWRDRNFLAVWSASTISVFGSLITRTALPFAAILLLDAGAAEIAAIRSVELIAALIVGLFAGAWVDRLLRRPILIWADLGRAVLLASIPVTAVLGLLGLPQLLVVSFGAAVFSTFFDVADNAYLPTVVPREKLVAANSALTATGSVAEFSAFGIGGFLIEVFTAPFAIAIDAVTFVVSALLLGTIKKQEPPPAPRADREPVLREIRDGIRIVAGSPVLRALALSHGGTHILWGVFGTSYLLFAMNELGLGPAAIGVIAAVGGIGSLAGSAMAPYMVRRFGIGNSILLGMVGFILGNSLIPLAPAGALLLGAAFLIAQQLIGDSLATVYEVTEVSLQQAMVGDRLLGRVNATTHTFTTLMTLFGAVLGGVVAETIGLRAAFALGLLGGVLSLAVVWFSPVRHIRDAPLRPTIGMPGDEMPITE